MNASELIINGDGSIFHLHLHPGEVADTVLLVGDPARVLQVAAHFDTIEFERQNREFCTVTGLYKDRRITVCSTGIGTDNVDIVINELDALVNIDFATRAPREEPQSLTLLRLGTCGAVQPEQHIGDLIFTHASVGIDCLLDFYADSPQVRNAALEHAVEQLLSRPSCCVDASLELAMPHIYKGITLSAPGFYAPQGRQLRLRAAVPDLVERLAGFEHHGLRVLNIEMESSAVLGLGRLLGHRAGCLCTVIAQRSAGGANPDYRPFVERMIEYALDAL